ncbi:KaiC domain-containing protein [Haloferax namakaokahaiae]|uniref:KaiC domain-containing protein n=1 Tax=Haloferax namakaokahaiae TaxID=1748331 RepID=A0ABD5ZB86_9EURY
MSDDDDWFERALREGDGEKSDGDIDDGATDAADAADETDAPDTTDTADAEADQEHGDFPPAEPTEFDAPDVSDEPAGDNPFATDFATAFENAPDLDGFDAGAMDSNPPRDSDDFDEVFGFSGGDSSEAQSFDEEEFESDIDRIDIGIEGLDDMILGGVPRRSLMVTIGSAGTGKTTFGLQFLNEVMKDGGSGVYITLEESRRRILETAEEKGWPFGEYEAENRLAIVDLDPVEMANSLSSIRNDLPRLVDDFGADRLVLDSVSLLEMMYDHPSKRRSEVFNFARSLKDAGVTTMLTSEASQENPYASRHGIVEYLSDAVFILQYVRPDDFRETRLAIEIQKIRDANHSRETKPYELTNDGISVYQQANIF